MLPFSCPAGAGRRHSLLIHLWGVPCTYWLRLFCRFMWAEGCLNNSGYYGESISKAGGVCGDSFCSGNKRLVQQWNFWCVMAFIAVVLSYRNGERWKPKQLSHRRNVCNPSFLPLSLLPFCSPTPIPKQPLMCFLSQYITFSKMCVVYGIILYVCSPFCLASLTSIIIWTSSDSVGIAYVNSSFFFIAKWYSTVWAYQYLILDYFPFGASRNKHSCISLSFLLGMLTFLNRVVNV